MVLPVSYDEPGLTKDAVGEAIDAGFRHIVLILQPPYPEKVARWVTDEFITAWVGDVTPCPVSVE